MRNIFFLTIIIAVCISCNEQPIDIPDFVVPVTEKVILIEEMTGVSCPNCPAGSAKIVELLSLFEGKLIAYSNHGDFLAEPVSESEYDFRTPQGAELENYFEFLGKPSATINRTKFDDQGLKMISSPDLWQNYIERAISEQDHLLELNVDIVYDPDTRIVSAATTAAPLQDISGELRITVMLTESHIIDAQKNQSEIILDYEHNHAMRQILTGVTGDVIANSPAANQLIQNNFSYTLPAEDDTWVADNMELIAFVSLFQGGEEIVLQAVAGHL